MGQQRDAEVIVVGGGPAGASTAWALAKEGVDVLVLDRARPFGFKFIASDPFVTPDKAAELPAGRCAVTRCST